MSGAALRYGESAAGWFSSPGPDNDVAVSTRVRLVRNLASCPFPGFMKPEQVTQLSERVGRVVAARWPHAVHLRLAELSGIERMILVERNLVSREVAGAPDAELYIHEDERLQIGVNGRDHLHIQSIVPGLELEESTERLWELEAALDDELRFAATLQFGYLTSRIDDLGTGMKASVMLHLPALMEREWLTPALRTIVDDEIGLKAFGTAPMQSRAAMYQLFTKLCIGTAENEMMEKLEDAVSQLIHYERNAREASGANRGRELQGEVAKAAETVRNARTISDAEAYDALSWLRLGVALGTIDQMLFEEVTSLFFRCQASHIAAATEGSDDGEQRATFLRNALRNRR